MEGLIILEPVQVLIILLEHFLVVLAITFCVEVVEQAEEDLERDERVGTGLMLRTHSHDVQLLRNLLKTAIQVEAMHEGLDVEDVRYVVLEVFLEVLASGR